MSIHLTYLVHGTTTDNENGISSGWSDAELSQLGIKQSLDLIHKIRNKKFDVIFCSDLRRAVRSARLTFGEKAIIIADPRLRECNYGIYNGKPSDIVESLQEKYISQPFPSGESYEDVKNRIVDFVSTLKEQYDHKWIAIVAHKAPQLALEVLLNGKTWEEAFAQDWRKRGAWQPGWEYEIS